MAPPVVILRIAFDATSPAAQTAPSGPAVIPPWSLAKEVVIIVGVVPADADAGMCPIAAVTGNQISAFPERPAVMPPIVVIAPGASNSVMHWDGFVSQPTRFATLNRAILRAFSGYFCSVNQMLPSGPTQMAPGALVGSTVEYSIGESGLDVVMRTT